MNSKLAHELLSMIDEHVSLRPAPVEYELAYQARVAIDRIRFAIRHIERIGPNNHDHRDAALQLLDALERLSRAEYRFQTHFHPQAPNVEPAGAVASAGAD